MKHLFCFFFIWIYLIIPESLGFRDLQNKENLLNSIKNQLVQVDSIVMKASTPGYLVVKEVDFLNFRVNLDKELLILDSVYSVFLLGFERPSVLFSDPEELIPKDKSRKVLSGKTQDENSFFSAIPVYYYVIFLVFSVYSVFISLKFYSYYSQDITTQDQLKIVSDDFESYKKSTIDRERKLKRELLDLKEKYSIEP